MAIVSGSEAAKASHVVYPLGPKGDPDDGEPYWSVLRVLPESKVSRVHWWYHPDSYDEWMPSDEASSSPGRRPL